VQALVRKEKPGLVKALDYVEQVCAGLGHAHACGIIHRDVKPQNLLLNADKTTVKIADFGVARVTVSDSPITRVGTNIYAPPEHSPVFAGQTGDLASHRLSPAADIYSLAKTVYVMITGDSPRAFANGPITSLPSAYRDEEWSEELLRTLRKATSDNHLERQQTVKDFWSDLSVVQRMAADRDNETVVRRIPETPQPHVEKGYSPVPPTLPDFEAVAVTNPGIRLPVATAVVDLPSRRPAYDTTPEARVDLNHRTNAVRPEYLSAAPRPVQVPSGGAKKGKFLRRTAIFIVALLLFTGVLWGTASYMRGKGILPEIKNPFKTPAGVANADVYLRPGPSTEGAPIGLVTKNSKVRIVNSQNNWYQVDVVEQGRQNPANSGQNATRGWLNGKYLDISDN
ncbi:MAG: protein kinase, partial [Acidobacteria bacterium]|nr:protein kinase [Acidobacteriota bacterium]